MTNTVVQYNGKPVDNGAVQIIAHRGGRGLAPENTLLAYQSALRQGVDYIDMDIVITKDNVLVVSHDPVLLPQITRNNHNHWIPLRPQLVVAQMNYTELLEYNVGRLQPSTAYADYFPYQQGDDVQHMPTLVEVIEFVKRHDPSGRVGFVIEIKQQDPATPAAFAEQLAQVLTAQDVLNRTEVQAFNWQCLILLKQACPAVKTAFLTFETEIEMGKTYPQVIKDMGGDCWHPFERDISQQDIINAHALGLKIAVWGYPEVEGSEFNYQRIRDLIDWGIDGIITDRPDILRGLLSVRQNLPLGIDVN